MGKKYYGGNWDNFDRSYVLYEQHKHPAIDPIMIGGYPVYLGACRDIHEDTVEQMDYVCALNGSMPYSYFGSFTVHINCELMDRGGVPKSWPQFIDMIAGLIRDNKKILAYCVGGHGRTGTFGASLIAVMEPDVPDPIDAIRSRHCHKAVESRAQAEAIFALRGKHLPSRYRAEFYVPPAPKTTAGTAQGGPSSPQKPTTNATATVAL